MLASKLLSGNDADLGELRQRRRIGGFRRIGLHELAEKGEILDRIHPVDLFAHRRLHVDRGIDRAGRRRPVGAVGAQRHQLELVLQGMHGRIVLRRAGAVDAAQQPHDAGRRLVLGDALRKRSAPSGSGDGIGLRRRARRALARNLEDLGPAVEHRKQRVAVLHVRDAENPGLLGDIEKRCRVERIGIGRGHVAEAGVGIFAKLDDLSHGPARARRFGDIGDDAPRHLHGHKRIAEGIGLDRSLEVFAAFQNVGEWSIEGQCGAREHRRAGKAKQCLRNVASGKCHEAVS